METQPLLSRSESIHDQLPTIALPKVDFDPDGDPENPMDWSRPYKLSVVGLLGLMAFTVTFTCNAVVPVADRVVLELDEHESRSAAIMLVTIWELGEAAGPLIIAPISEIYGRYPIFNIANVIFIVGVLLGAVSQTADMFIFSRFLTGFATASNVLNPAIIGDVFPSELRGTPLSLVMLAPLLGGAIGPAVGGTIADKIGWRWILMVCALLATICEVCFFVLLKETYKVPILQRRAARMRRESRDESLKCAWDAEDASKVWWLTLRTSVVRPWVVMWNSSVLQIMSFFGALVFTFFYIMATTLPGILREVYDLSPTQIGFSFLFFSLGASGAIYLCTSYLDTLYVQLGRSCKGSIPEHRLPFLVGNGVLLPFVVALYGWAPAAHWPIYILLLAVVVLGFCMLMIMVPLSSYVVDAFGLYSASAMTIVLIARCLAGTLLPLCVPVLTGAVGLGYAFVILGACSLLLVPLPILVMRYGSRWRQNSVYTKDE